MDLRLRIVGAVEHGSSIREEKAAALAMVGGPRCQGEVMPATRPAPALPRACPAATLRFYTPGGVNGPKTAEILVFGALGSVSLCAHQLRMQIRTALILVTDR